MVLEKQRGNDVTKEQLAAVYSQMLKENDTKQAQKILDLYDKQYHETISICFLGHFSAGKSSMINTLLETDILPRRPIPTSANIVRLTSGKGVARIYFKHHHPVEYSEPYDIEEIKAYSQNKAAIEQIDINTSKPIIPPNTYIIDTPGIDAANDADRVITEEALHVADHVFYVMDYNHVQSEVNLDFLKKLQDQYIPYSIIINQIDKHDHREVSFTAFQNSIETTFTQWQLLPDHIYYTSLIDHSNKLNQLKKVKMTLFQMLKNPYKQIQNTYRAAKHIIDVHKQSLKDQISDKQEDIEQKRASTSGDKDLDALNKQLDAYIKEAESIEQALLFELNHTLNNAYLMPAVTRDHAEAFLHSIKPDFKVGLLGSKHKTEKEQTRRLNTFVNAIQENMQATIQWKLQDKMINMLKQYNLHEDELVQHIQTIKVSYTQEDVLKLVKSRARVNGQYVLNFTNEVASDIKQTYRRLALTVITSIKNEIDKRNKGHIKHLQQQKENLEKNHTLELEKEKLNQQLNDTYAAIDAAFETMSPDQRLIEQADDALHRHKLTFQKQSGHTMKKIAQQQEFKKNEHVETNNTNHSTDELSADDIIEDLDRVIKSVQSTPGFSSFVSDLKRKQTRLKNRRYTIALFGAFSAGKSTFANALLGEAILPATPNPTTAAVNRINPISTDMPHGTVTIHVKDEATLVNDLFMIIGGLAPPDNDLNALMKWIEKGNIQYNSKLSKVYQAYLQAMLSGYHLIKRSIGQSIMVSLEDFPMYVTDETKASFIESIDLYYDCPLTRQGITLVDTPGADSVNARHTDVAFDYIKQADALLYVTYYNHALSKADKTFLMQLGRVKDAFELDKMFFIVNAVDLAASEDDLNLVMSYVEDQLAHLGIRLPTLYPVSSRQSLSDKQAGRLTNEKMQQFEQDFNRFIHQHLAALMKQSALWDINRTYQGLLNYKEAVQMDEAEKDAFKNALQSDLEKGQHIIETTEITAQTKQLEQKFDKQIYYISGRVSLRYHDLFKEAFNPTTITSNKEANIELSTALQTLIDDIAHELLQELRAVSLRLEQTERTLAQDVYEQLFKACGQLNDVFAFPSFEAPALSTPDYDVAFKSIDLMQFNPALAVFKNTKRFFVNNEKEIMKEKIHDILEPLATAYLDTNKQIVTDHYMSEWITIIESMKQEMRVYLNQQARAQLDMLDNSADTDTINQQLKTLEQVLNTYNMKSREAEA